MILSTQTYYCTINVYIYIYTLCFADLQITFQGVTFLPSGVSVYARFLKIMIEVNNLDRYMVKEGGWGKEGYAHCKTLLLQHIFFLYQLNFMEVIKLKMLS